MMQTMLYLKKQKEYNELDRTINERTAAASAEVDIEIAKKREQVKKEAAKVSKFRELYKA